VGVQSSEPGTMHASNAAALFSVPNEYNEDDIDGEGGGEEDTGWDSRGGSPVDEDIIPVRYPLFLKEEFY
jgi:hypothetical protein